MKEKLNSLQDLTIVNNTKQEDVYTLKMYKCSQ